MATSEKQETRTPTGPTGPGSDSARRATGATGATGATEQRARARRTERRRGDDEPEANFVIRSRRADRALGEPGTKGVRVELPAPAGSEQQIQEAVEQDDREMGERTGVSPFSGLDFRDGVDPVSGARQYQNRGR